jgi:hypothetical protein
MIRFIACGNYYDWWSMIRLMIRFIECGNYYDWWEDLLYVEIIMIDDQW